jgi:hypothetical protein
MRILLSCLLLGTYLTAAAQAPRGTIVSIRSSQKDPNKPNTWMVDTQLKATAGTLLPDNRDYEYLLPNGDKAYVRVEIFDKLATGKTDQAILTCYNGEPKAGQVLAPRGTFAIKPPAGRTFAGVLAQAFLGEGKNEFNLILKQFSGHLLPGDVLQTEGPKGRCQATVKAIILGGTNQPLDMLSPAMTDAMVEVVSAGCILDADYKLTLSGSKTMTAEPAPAAAAKAKTFGGKRTVFPTNATLRTNEIAITIHNVVQFFPQPEKMVLGKVDPALNYYVLDATVENLTNRVVDAGDYMLRLNFYDAQGNSADEFGRVFKNEKNKTDDVSRGADALDKGVFGGSSALRFATIQVAYTQELPTYDQKAYDAVWGKLQPGQLVRCEAVRVIGVPKTYQPTGIGTWKDRRSNLVMVPIALKQ